MKKFLMSLMILVSFANAYFVLYQHPAKAHASVRAYLNNDPHFVTDMYRYGKADRSDAKMLDTRRGQYTYSGTLYFDLRLENTKYNGHSGSSNSYDRGRCFLRVRLINRYGTSHQRTFVDHTWKSYSLSTNYVLQRRLFNPERGIKLVHWRVIFDFYQPSSPWWHQSPCDYEGALVELVR